MGSSPGATGGGDRRPLAASTALVTAKKTAFLTAALMNVASIVERADESILPAVFLFIGKSLNVNLSQLGFLTLIRGLVQVSAGGPTDGLAGKQSRLSCCTAPPHAGAVLPAERAAGRPLRPHLRRRLGVPAVGRDDRGHRRQPLPGPDHGLLRRRAHPLFLPPPRPDTPSGLLPADSRITEPALPVPAPVQRMAWASPSSSPASPASSRTCTPQRSGAPRLASWGSPPRWGAWLVVSGIGGRGK